MSHQGTKRKEGSKSRSARQRDARNKDGQQKNNGESGSGDGISHSDKSQGQTDVQQAHDKTKNVVSTSLQHSLNQHDFERLFFITSNLIGQKVEVQTNCGIVWEGYFHSFNVCEKKTKKEKAVSSQQHPTSSQSDLSNNIDLHSFLSAADANSLVFTLCYARVKGDVLAIPKSRLELFVSDIVYVRAHEVEVFDPVSSITTSLCVEEDQTATIISTHPSIKNQTNNTTASITVDSDTFTDSGICRSRSSPHHSQAGVERELTPFVDFITPANTSIDLTLDETESIRDWDQFEANERLFGVQTTYHEDLYTIPLDRNSEVYKAHEALASQIEQEIVQQPSSNVHLAEERGQLDFTDMDDEERYSAVTRSTSGNLKNTKPFRPPSSPTQLNTTNTTSKHVSPLRGGRLQSQTQSQPPLPPQQQQQQQQQQQKLSREGSFITLSPTEQRENSSSHGDIASTSSVASNSKHNSSPAEQGTPVLQTISKVSSVSNMSQKMTRSCSQGSLVHRPRSKGSGQRTASLSGMGSKSPLLFVSPLHSRGSSPDLNAIAEWRKIRKQLNKSPGSPLSSPKQSRRTLHSPLIKDPKVLDALGLHPASPKYCSFPFTLLVLTHTFGLDRVISDFLTFQQREEQSNKTKPSKQEQLESFRKFSQYLEKKTRKSQHPTPPSSAESEPVTTLTSSSSTSSSSLSTTSKLTTLSVANNTNVTSSSLVSGPGYAHRTTTTISPNEENKNSALQPTISKLNPNAQEFQPLAQALESSRSSVTVPQPRHSAFFPSNHEIPYIDTRQPISEVYFKALKIKISGLSSLTASSSPAASTSPSPSPSPVPSSLSPRNMMHPTSTSPGNRKPHQVSVLWETGNSSRETWKSDMSQYVLTSSSEVSINSPVSYDPVEEPYADIQSFMPISPVPGFNPTDIHNVSLYGRNAYSDPWTFYPHPSQGNAPHPAAFVSPSLPLPSLPLQNSSPLVTPSSSVSATIPPLPPQQHYGSITTTGPLPPQLAPSFMIPFPVPSHSNVSPVVTPAISSPDPTYRYSGTTSSLSVSLSSSSPVSANTTTSSASSATFPHSLPPMHSSLASPSAPLPPQYTSFNLQNSAPISFHLNRMPYSTPTSPQSGANNTISLDYTSHYRGTSVPSVPQSLSSSPMQVIAPLPHISSFQNVAPSSCPPTSHDHKPAGGYSQHSPPSGNGNHSSPATTSSSNDK